MFEISMINVNFALLFGTMFFYWIESALFLPESVRFLPYLGSRLSCFLQAGFLGLRWVSSGHFPLSNLYESLLFLSWSLTTLLVFLNYDLTAKTSVLTMPSSHQTQVSTNTLGTNAFLGSIMTPAILLIHTFAVFSLPTDLKASSALVPALQSNWLVMHVTVMVLSYAALLAGCLFSIAYLVVCFVSPISVTESSLVVTPNDSQSLYFQQLATKLDNLSYRILGLGFPLLTIGLLSGAVWANQTWGSYWSWDPKETWALITWFVFAIYLHTRISKGWSGKESAFLAIFGLIILWICYLGVNLMGKGLHSYGFFQ
jgi:cytochrome c-type biogenesis protein CcsB